MNQESRTEEGPSYRLIEQAGKVGAALAALVMWDEQLHDWTKPETYLDLKQLASEILRTTGPAYYVAAGLCLNCGHPEHSSDRQCRALTGNQVYDMHCRCQWSASEENGG